MAFMTVKLVPGVHAEQTPLLLQAGVIQSNNVRWKDGLPEKIGGWQKFYFGGAPGITVAAAAAFTTDYTGIAMPPNPGVQPGMTVFNQTTGKTLGTVASYGPVLDQQTAIGSWTAGSTGPLNMAGTNANGVVPGMSIQDQNYGYKQIGSVVSFIGGSLITTPLTDQTASHGGNDVLVFSSGPGLYPTPPTNNVLVLTGQIGSNSAGASDVLFFSLSGGSGATITPPPLDGPIRELWTWEDLNSSQHLAAAGGDNVSVITGGVVQPIVPQFAIRHPSAFATTSGSPLVVVTDTGSRASAYESVTLQTPYSISGICIYPGNYPIIVASSVDSYTINVGQNAGATVAGTPCTITSSVGSNVFAVHLANHGLQAGSNFSIVLPTVVGGVVLDGFFLVANLVDANNFTILAPNQAAAAQTANYGNVAAPGIQLSQWVIGTPTPPPTIAASAAFTTDYAMIKMPPNPGFVISGMTVLDQSTGVILGTVQSYGPTNFSDQVRTSYSTGDTTIVMIHEGWRVALPGMQVYDQNHGDVLIGTVASYINTNLVLTAGAPFNSGGPSMLTFSSGAQNILYILPPGPGPGPLPANSAGAGDILAFFGAPSPPPTGTTPVTADDWCMFNFGSILLINPEDGPIFQYDPTTGLSGARLVTAAPSLVHGMFLAMPEQMVVAYGASTQGVQDPMLIAWCDAGNFNTWILNVNNQAGTYRLSRGSKIVGGLQIPMQAMLWTDVGLWLMTYIGYPDVWGFSEIAQECGLIAKKAAGVLGSQVFWMGQDKFWTFMGGQVQPLPCEVWDAVFQNLNTDLVDLIRCGTDTAFDGIAWFYPSLATRLPGALQENDSFVKFNRTTGEWDYGTPIDIYGDGNTGGVMISDWIDANVFGKPISAMTDPTGAQSQLMWMDSGQDADGQPIHWWIRTGLFLLSEGEDFLFVDRCRPDFRWRKFSSPASPSAQIQITLYAQDDSDNPLKPPAVYGPFTVTDSSGPFDPRARGRYFSLKVEGDDLGSFARLGAVKFRFSPDGRAG